MKSQIEKINPTFSKEIGFEVATQIEVQSLNLADADEEIVTPRSTTLFVPHLMDRRGIPISPLHD